MARPRKMNYGWKPDPHDERDHLYMLVGKPKELPHSIDLRIAMPPVYDQGSLGSCTGNAIAGAIDFLDKRSTTPSRLFIYYNERAMEGTIKQDAGAYIRDGIKSVNKLGVCDETKWPYVVGKFANKPNKTAFAQAAQRKVLGYQRITSLQSMKTCLASGKPFVFGFSVYESFESDHVAALGVIDLPRPGERVLGGHAVLAVGYDDFSQRLIVRNSWGADWGQKGYFSMPYDYVTNSKLADDMWTISV